MYEAELATAYVKIVADASQAHAEIARLRQELEALGSEYRIPIGPAAGGGGLSRTGVSMPSLKLPFDEMCRKAPDLTKEDQARHATQTMWDHTVVRSGSITGGRRRRSRPKGTSRPSRTGRRS